MMSRGHVQRGQAMTEFLIAMAALLPIFLAINYLGRYGDLQQRATQASRYAAFQRAMQPSAGKLSDATIEDQMRARFFLAQDHLAKDGKHLKSDDSASKIKDDTGQPVLWRDLGGAALLSKPDQVKLTWAGAGMGSGTMAKTLDTVTGLVGKDWNGGRLAMVELELVNRLDLEAATPKLLKIGAATAAAGDGLGSAGSTATRNAAAKMVPSTVLPGVVDQAISLAMSLFEPEGPKFGCIKPDVVASGGASSRLDGAPNNSQCK